MARIVLGSYMVRYPLGGMMSWVLQYLIGFARLGHEVYFVEKSGYPNACFDPAKKQMSDDCRFGTNAVHQLLNRFDLGDRWCYVDNENQYHGLSESIIEDVLAHRGLVHRYGHPRQLELEECSHTGFKVFSMGNPLYAIEDGAKNRPGTPSG